VRGLQRRRELQDVALQRDPHDDTPPLARIPAENSRQKTS
jgi:hypothetical protein